MGPNISLEKVIINPCSIRNFLLFFRYNEKYFEGADPELLTGSVKRKKKTFILLRSTM